LLVLNLGSHIHVPEQQRLVVHHVVLDAVEGPGGASNNRSDRHVNYVLTKFKDSVYLSDMRWSVYVS
jgi:hypothetical protein